MNLTHDQHDLRRQRRDHDHPGEHRHRWTRGIVALQGKPQLPVPAGMTQHWANRCVRVPTPTYEFVVGTGALPAQTRRAIADTGECLGCHVGSLYQHGGTASTT